MKRLTFLVLLSLLGCGTPRNELADMTEEVIKKKTGVDIRVTPLEEEKPAVTLVTRSF